MSGRQGGPRYILNHMYGSAERTLFDPHARDNCTEPYIKLRDRCAELGYAFEATRDQPLEDCRWLLFWDAASITPGSFVKRAAFNLGNKARGGSTRDLFAEARRAGMKDKLALFIFEPPSVYPENFDPTVHEEFSIVFTADPTLVDGRKYHRIHFPNPMSFPRVEPLPFLQKKLLVDISGYKFSNHERELFTERRRTARFFEQRYPNDFDLFGEGWNMSLRSYMVRRLRGANVRREFFPSYRGPVRNKWEVYPKYKFGMAYENIVDQPGYVTLKIFDCLRCGCVPIYLGAPDITDYVDKEAFIDRRKFSSNEELGKYIASVSQQEYEGLVEAGRAYLRSERFRPFLTDSFVDTVVRVLWLEA